MGGVVRGSTGHAGLSFVDQVPTPTTLTGPAAVSENVTAGSTVVTAQDGVACATTCLFAIDLSGVTFSGTQFKLYISQDGFSQIAGAPEDIQYGPTFNVADFSHSPTLKEVDANVAGLGTQKFYIGNVGGTDVVVGPIPIQISSAYNFIKIFDGQVTSVAVTSGTMNIVPGLTLSPTSGPAGSTVSATGGGFPSNKLIDLVYSYSTVFQNNTGSALQTGNWTTGINTTAGYWSFSGSMLNAMQQILDAAGDNLTFTSITVTAALMAVPHTAIASAVFNENTGFLAEVLSLDTSGVVQFDSNPYALDQGYGNQNGTGYTSAGVEYTNLIEPNAVALGTLVIAGNWSAVNSQVTFWVGGTLNHNHNAVVGGTQIGSATTNGAGFFNGTATLPVLSEGNHWVYVSAAGVLTWFEINIIPSLTLTPSMGPVGTTVTATAYGFPANSAVYLYWYEHNTGDDTFFNLGNFTTGASGQFNVTVTFTVAHTFGGDHEVAASTGYAVNPTSVPATEIADTEFNVTPTLTVSPTTLNANQEGFIVASGTGFNPSIAYDALVDHSWVSYIVGGSNGDLQVNITSAGFRPGTHQIELDCYYEYCSAANNTAPVAFAYFNVTLTGDLIGAQFASITTSVTNLQGSLTSIQSSLTSIQSSLGTITSDVSGLGAQLTAITNDVSGLSSLGGQISSLSQQITGLSTTLSSVTSSLSSIQSSISTAATNASNAATSAQSAATAAQNASSGTSTAQTYVLVVAVLAAITLVLELAILVRKLS